MKFFLDENIPGSWARQIIEKYPGSIYAAKDSAFSGADDREIYRFLCREPFVHVSNDSDFLHPISYPPGPTAGIIVLRSKWLTKEQALEKLLMFLSVARPSDLKGALVVVSRNSIRTRRF